MTAATQLSARKTAQTKPAGKSRKNNRQQDVLDSAARLFSQYGYEGASMRDLATAVGMKHGSIYYHYPSKEDLFVAVYAEGKRRNDAQFALALEDIEDPWDRLEAASLVHINATLEQSDYSLVLRQHVIPENAKLREQLVQMRDSHETLFRKLIDDLPLSPKVDRKYLRLVLLSALMHTYVWYRPGGDSPKTIARKFLKLLGRPEKG